jgi:hypothetical protein
MKERLCHFRGSEHYGYIAVKMIGTTVSSTIYNAILIATVIFLLFTSFRNHIKMRLIRHCIT